MSVMPIPLRFPKMKPCCDCPKLFITTAIIYPVSHNFENTLLGRDMPLMKWLWKNNKQWWHCREWQTIGLQKNSIFSKFKKKHFLQYKKSWNMPLNRKLAYWYIYGQAYHFMIWKTFNTSGEDWQLAAIPKIKFKG